MASVECVKQPWDMVIGSAERINSAVDRQTTLKLLNFFLRIITVLILVLIFEFWSFIIISL